MRLGYMALAGAALLAANRYVSRRLGRTGRRVRTGAIEDPEVARGYLWVAGLPQMRLMNAVVARRAVDGLQAGRALDLGSGPGRLAIGMARLAPGGRFLVVDLRRDVGLLPWLLLWFAGHVVVPPALRRASEPMGSREAGYTPRELVEILTRSTLQDWQVTSGPLWLAVESA